MGTLQSGRKKAGVWLFCLLISAVLLTICTKSSFLYPLNDWQDANIFFTMGKGMMHGKVLYRDMYDQKGPLLYLLYGLASLISSKSFFGVYLLEVLSFSAFLYGCWKLIGLFTEQNRLLALPVLGTLILSSMAVTHGGSVEQLCLPFFVFSLERSIRYYRFEQPGTMSYRDVFINGLFAGCILWMKYTLLGFYIAWMGVLAISLAANHQWKRAIVSCLVFLSAMAVTFLPWLVYFGVNAALPDLFLYYFYYNMTQYSEVAGASILTRVLTIGQHTLATFFRNAQYSLLIVLGVLWFTFKKRAGATPWLRVNLWTLAVLTCIFIYIGGIGYRYYGLVLAAFAPLGMIPLLLLYNDHIENKPFVQRFGKWFPAVLTVLGLGFCLLVSDNTYYLSYGREDTPQYQFAKIMEERAKDEPITLLNRGFMDGGFYLAADVVPDCKYFTTLNLTLPEISEGQNQFIREGLVAFAVTRGSNLNAENFELIASAECVYEDYDWEYHLYQRID